MWSLVSLALNINAIANKAGDVVHFGMMNICAIRRTRSMNWRRGKESGRATNTQHTVNLKLVKALVPLMTIPQTHHPAKLAPRGQPEGVPTGVSWEKRTTSITRIMSITSRLRDLRTTEHLTSKMLTLPLGHGKQPPVRFS